MRIAALALIAAIGVGPDAARLEPHPAIPEATAASESDIRSAHMPRETRGCRRSVRAPSPMLRKVRAAAFPDTTTPDVAVHVPQGFDPTASPGLVVYFRGFENCLANVVGSVDAPCTEGGPVRDALRLHEQLEAARVNAILIAVELRFDFASPDPGELAKPGRMREIVEEVLGEHLASPFRCQLTPADFSRVVIVSHSGGYQAAAAALTVGELPNVREVVLLDSLYGELPAFAEWIEQNAERFDRARDDSLRFADVYTCCGGTADNTRALASIAKRVLGERMVDDATTGDPNDEALAAPVLFKQVDLAHVEVTKRWVRTIAEHAGFAPLRR